MFCCCILWAVSTPEVKKVIAVESRMEFCTAVYASHISSSVFKSDWFFDVVM